MNHFIKRLDDALVIFESRSSVIKLLESAAESLSISITIIGGMAVAAHGFSRFTDDCDVLISTPDADKLATYVAKYGYTPVGNNKLQNKDGFKINICTPQTKIPTGKFPDIEDVSVGVHAISLPRLLTMKIVANRSKDRIDFIELIKINKLSADYINSNVTPLLDSQLNRKLALQLFRRANEEAKSQN